MLEAFPKAAFSVLATSHGLKRLALRYGLRRPDSFARRFIAGETVEEAIATARAIEASGLTVTLDHLGESVSTTDAAADATKMYVGIIAALAEAGISHNVSIKLTQLGSDIDRATSIDNVRRVLDAAARVNFFVRLDMERSTHTELTLDTFETLWRLGYRNAGVVIQSYLRRSATDVNRMIALGARIRLVKGAYSEPRDIAFRQKIDIDASFVELMKVLLTTGTYPAIATHDPVMIDATRAFAAQHDIPKDRYEFQMLYGTRRDLQTQLVSAGHAVRISVPFGREWFPYFMRRLGERPADVGVVMRSAMTDRR